MHIGLQAGFVKVDLNVDKSTLHFKHYDRSLRIICVCYWVLFTERRCKAMQRIPRPEVCQETGCNFRLQAQWFLIWCMEEKRGEGNAAGLQRQRKLLVLICISRRWGIVIVLVRSSEPKIIDVWPRYYLLMKNGTFRVIV
jgi:hypothetical protein